MGDQLDEPFRSSNSPPFSVSKQASKQATLFAKIMKKYKYTVESWIVYIGGLPVKLSLILAGHPFY